jgi:hypothetical protein
MNRQFIISICIFVACENTINSKKKDPHVEPYIPILEVPKVIGYTHLDLFGIGDLSSETVDLGPSGDARFQEMADHILINNF